MTGRGSNLFGTSKITEFRDSVNEVAPCKKDICGLDVLVDDAEGVDFGKTKYDLDEPVEDLLLG